MKKEYFLIDKWCYLGSIVIDNDGHKKTDLVNDLVFDLDIYNILKQYLKNPQNKKKIQHVRNNYMNELGVQLDFSSVN